MGSVWQLEPAAMEQLAIETSMSSSLNVYAWGAVTVSGRETSIRTISPSVILVIGLPDRSRRPTVPSELCVYELKLCGENRVKRPINASNVCRIMTCLLTQENIQFERGRIIAISGVGGNQLSVVGCQPSAVCLTGFELTRWLGADAEGAGNIKWILLV